MQRCARENKTAYEDRLRLAACPNFSSVEYHVNASGHVHLSRSRNVSHSRDELPTLPRTPDTRSQTSVGKFCGEAPVTIRSGSYQSHSRIHNLLIVWQSAMEISTRGSVIGSSDEIAGSAFSSGAGINRNMNDLVSRVSREKKDRLDEQRSARMPTQTLERLSESTSNQRRRRGACQALLHKRTTIEYTRHGVCAEAPNPGKIENLYSPYPHLYNDPSL